MLRESDMARSILNELTAAYDAYGFYTYADFFQFGLRLGIKASRVEKIISEFVTEKALVTALVQQSFLKEEVKQEYLRLNLDKLRRSRLSYNK